MVAIALGNLSTDECSAGDSDLNGEITVDELVLAIRGGLEGCDAVMTPRTATQTGGFRWPSR